LAVQLLKAGASSILKEIYSKERKNWKR
jgi:hypothetical protein